MKRIIALLLCLLCTVSLFACGAGSNDETSNENNSQQTANVNLTEIKDSIITKLAIDGAMDMDTSMLLNLYGIDEADVKESACFATMDGVFPDEIVMVRATDSNASARIAEKLQTRLEAVLVQSKNYDAQNYEIAQKCKVITKGDIVALFISANHETMQGIFNNAF